MIMWLKKNWKENKNPKNQIYFCFFYEFIYSHAYKETWRENTMIEKKRKSNLWDEKQF